MPRLPLHPIVLVLALAATLAPAVHAQIAPAATSDFQDVTTLPSDATSEPINAFIAAYNANDAAAIRSFLEKYTTPEFLKMQTMDEHLEMFLRMRRSTGVIKLHAIRSHEPARPKPELIFKDSVYGNWHGVTLAFAADTNTGGANTGGGALRISEIRFSPVPAPKNQTATTPITEAQMLEQAQKLVQSGCDMDVFSGTAVISHGKKVVLQMSCGEASKRYHIKNNVDTKYNLGSMNKMFTSLAIAQLMEQGKLSYADKIDKYLDDSWLPKDITSQITIAQLLSHTSGLGSYFNDAYFKSSRDLFREVDDYKPLIKGDKPQFTPGSDYAYSNSGMLLLGAIVEKVSGQNYFAYIRQHIYAPAGMKDSDCYPLDEPVENLAMGYIPQPLPNWHWSENTFLHVLRGGPAGGGYASAPDLLRFGQALQDGKLVKPATLKTMWQDQSKHGYGYGFQVRSSPAGREVGHSGGFPGLNGQFTIHADQAYTLAVLSNYDEGAAPLARQISLLIERTIASPVK